MSDKIFKENINELKELPIFIKDISKYIDFDYIDLGIYDEQYWCEKYPNYSQKLHQYLAKVSREKTYDEYDTFKIRKVDIKVDFH